MKKINIYNLFIYVKNKMWRIKEKEKNEKLTVTMNIVRLNNYSIGSYTYSDVTNAILEALLTIYYTIWQLCKFPTENMYFY